ncbi:MAG: sulfur oxidation c-type cytochrome SoxX [Halioglobus sp.]
MKNRTGQPRVMTVILHGLGVTAMTLLGGLPSLAHASPESIAAGEQVASDRKLGNCYSCHMVVGAELAGNAGPPLIQMKSRYPDRAVLRAQIADPRSRNPNTIMPPYGAHNILTEQQLDQLVDYVLSL